MNESNRKDPVIIKKEIGAAALMTPMPVCIVAAYDKDGKPNAMNAAWGINSGRDEIALFISKPHKTTKNILETKAFTVSIADAANVVPADYVGIDTEHTFSIIGKVVKTQVEESALDENGKIDITKLNAISFDTFQFGYYTLGEKVATAWDAGKPLV